jgi:hypothetical protein
VIPVRLILFEGRGEAMSTQKRVLVTEDLVSLTGEAILGPLQEAVLDCLVLQKPVDSHLPLEILECFDWKTSYGLVLGKQVNDRAGPGTM